MNRTVIIGGGPAGYEAALAAAGTADEVTLVTDTPAGGSCVLHDCVPSKTFIVDANTARISKTRADVAEINERVRSLSIAQSDDIHAGLVAAGVRIVTSRARLSDPTSPYLHTVETDAETFNADTVLIATGATPRTLPDAQPDGERILTYQQLYTLGELPEELIVIGSGVTGAEFASAYCSAGSRVTLVSSRDRVLPHEDSDAAALLEKVFAERGVELVPRARATAITREGERVRVALSTGEEISGTHALLTIGQVPNTAELGLEQVGVARSPGGHILVDRVSRTSVPGIYASGDCTGVLPLASVAAEQGRVAMAHALGEAVEPLNLRTIPANVFTDPEIATVGVGQATVEAGEVRARCMSVDLERNARAKMLHIEDGFVKLYARPSSDVIIGGVVVAPGASELILPIVSAVQNSLTVSELASTTAIYPSLSGSITAAAWRLR